MALRHLKSGPTALGVDALVGKRVTVLEEVTADSGRVKPPARSGRRNWKKPGIPGCGSTGTVVEIRGATAIIRPY